VIGGLREAKGQPRAAQRHLWKIVLALSVLMLYLSSMGLSPTLVGDHVGKATKGMY